MRASRLRLVVVSAVAIAAAAGTPRPARADVNVERQRAKLGTAGVRGLTGSIDFKLGYRQGNVNLLDVGSKFQLAYATGRHFMLALNDSQLAARTLAREGGTTSDLGGSDARFRNRHMGHLRYNFRFIDRLAAEAFTQIEFDEFLLVRTRWLLGLGLRLVLFENDDFAAYLGSAYMPEYEALDARRLIAQQPPAGPDNWWHRWSNFLSLRFRAADRLSLETTTYVQPRFDHMTDLRVLTDQTIEVDITDRFGLKLTASLRYDSRPPIYCREQFDAAQPCAGTDVLTLRSVDIAVENALSIRF